MTSSNNQPFPPQSSAILKILYTSVMRFLLFALFCLLHVSQAIDCNFPRCICLGLQSITYFCNDPVQDLSGYGQRLPEIEPGTFSQAAFVTNLSLANNAPLLLYSDSFEGLTNVTAVDLSGNNIGILPDGVLSPMASLTQLNLSNNALSSLNPQAFTGLLHLMTLSLGGNMLPRLPLTQLFEAAPGLSSISLFPNPIDCNDANITELVQLASSGIITDGDLLFCSDGTKFSELLLPTTTVAIVTTTATPPETSTSMTPSHCPAQTTLLQTGYFDWPLSAAGVNITSPCTNGPQDGSARRQCTELGVWSFVDESECNKASETVQVLAAIAEGPITPETSMTVASQLATVTSDPSGITVEELSTVVEIAEQLIQVGSSSVEVLNETLLAFNSLVEFSTDTLTEATPQLINNLRSVLDTLLLDALSMDKTQIVISFSNLAVGGAYLPATSNGHLLAAIDQSELEIELSGTSNDGDILVDVVGGMANSSIQVTAYRGDELFIQSNCSNASNDSVRGDITGPIISVINQGATSNDTEVVTITYNELSNDRTEVVCVRWNSDPNCGGGRWVTFGCVLTRHKSEGVLQCVCQQHGVYTIINLPGRGSEPTAVAPSSDPSITRIVFYVVSCLPLLFYLTIVITVLIYRELRSEPMFQVLASLSLSQGLTHLFLMLSYELSGIAWLCYTLGLIFHYLILVTLTWMASLPVVMVIEVFRRLWYEKAWLIVPFAAFSIVWPAIPTAIYGGFRHSLFDNTSSICWLEASIFPSTFTYLFAFTYLVTIATLLVVLVLLCCSDYSIESSTYLQLGAMLLNTIAFLPSIILVFFTASAQRFNTDPQHLLAATSITVLISGAVFFVCFGLCRSKVRTAMLCRGETDKAANYAATWQQGARQAQSRRRSSALSLVLRRRRRPPIKLSDEMNISYIDDYLGYTHPTPVPLAMLGQVQPQGRVKRNSDLGSMGNGVGPLHRLSQTSEA